MTVSRSGRIDGAGAAGRICPFGRTILGDSIAESGNASDSMRCRFVGVRPERDHSEARTDDLYLRDSANDRRDLLPARNPNLIVMRTVRVLSLASFAAALLSPRAAGAQDIREVVIRLHRAGDTVSIRGAAVTIDHTIEAGNTDAAGIVRVPDLEDGGHIIEVVARGYQAYFDNFKTGADIPQPIQLELIPVQASDTAKAKGQTTDLKFAGFDARRTKGQGKFFTRAQLEAASGRPLANLLKTDAGAFFMAGPHGESQLAMRSPKAGASPCYAAVVRDGVRIYPFDGATPPDLDKIFAEQLAGLELYARPATVPAELRDAGACGALVLWSR